MPGSFNLVDKLRSRQLSSGSPGSNLSRQRQFYENIVPNDQAKLVEPPECHICKFLPSGNLVCFGNMQHEILVYEYVGPSCCVTSMEDELLTLPDAMSFARFFKLKYRRLLAHGNEVLCKELCLAAYEEKFLICASCTPPSTPAAPNNDQGTLQSIPLLASTTFHVIDAHTGELCGQYSIHDDFVHLSHANGVYLLEDRLCILAVRSQTIHLLHVSRQGQLLVSQKLGKYIQDDDELLLQRQEEAQGAWNAAHAQDAQTGMSAFKERSGSHLAAGPGPSSQGSAPPPRLLPGRQPSPLQRVPSAPLPHEPPWFQVLGPPPGQRPPTPPATGRGGHPQGRHATAQRQPPAQRPRLDPAVAIRPLQQATADSTAPQPAGSNRDEGMIMGIKQRLLAYLYLLSQKRLKVDGYEKDNFSYRFVEYFNLAMWKVQMLDRDTLLMSMGPPDANMGSRETSATTSQIYCLVVWSISQARVVDLHEVGAAEVVNSTLLRLYQHHWRHFHAGCIVTPWHRFLQPPSALHHASMPTQAVRRVLANLPASSQVLSPCPYLDPSLFQYDEKLMSAMMRLRPFSETPIRFTARSRPDRTSFRIQTIAGEPPATAPGGRFGRHYVAHHFHPHLPLVLCLVQSFTEPPQLTIFLRRR